MAVKHCLCPDGKRRLATITSEPDTFFSVPARVQYKGKTVSGFVTGRETDDYQPDMEFIPYTYGKNGALFEPSASTVCKRLRGPIR